MKYPKITPKEIEIIKQAKDGDERAFSTIFYKYKSFVDDLLYTYLKDRDEANDLTNIVFIKVHDKLQLFTEYNSFIGWLKTLSKNVAIDYLRVHKKKNSMEKDIDISQNYDAPIIDDPINHLAIKEILKYIKTNFPYGHDKVFEYVIEGMPYSEISKRLRMPLNTIKSIVHRLRPKIIKNFNY
jgi:RNA polymerase sigma-70 factor, ECF subfamily